MKLIVGLGNPGGEYYETRHNVGFRLVDELAERIGHTVFEKRSKGLLGRGLLGGESVLLLKPMTYMNLSGECVGPVAGYFKIPTEDIIVVHDDLDIETGRIKLKTGGGHGGHNGLRSLIQHLPDADFVRIRTGVGRPPPRWDTADYVLSKFSKDEVSMIDEVVQTAMDAVETILREGIRVAMREHNRSPAKAE